MELSGFERAMIGLLLGNTPQRRPAGMKMAVALLDRLEMTEEMITRLDGVPLLTLLSSEKHEGIDAELSADEGKFIAKVMITNGNFGGRMLRYLMPLWERLYPKWEELAADAGPERRRRPAR